MTKEEMRKKHGFYRATLEDSDVLYGVPMDTFDRAQNIQRLRNPHVFVFVSADDDAILVLEPAWGDVPWLSAHAWSAKSGRGRKLKRLFWSVYIWVFQNTEFDVITGVVPTNLRYYKIFLGSIGARRETEILGTAVYSCDRTMVPEFEKKLKALRVQSKTQET